MDSLLFIRGIRKWQAAYRATWIRCCSWAFVIFAFNLFPIQAQSQASKSDTVSTKWSLIAVANKPNGILVSADRKGFFYVADINGNIQQFKPNAEKGLLYSPAQQIRPTVLDAWNGLSIMVFSRDFQEFTLLDRFLSAEKSTPIPNSKSSFAAMATISNDNNLWVLDVSNFSLNKFQLNTGRLLFSNPLDLKLREELREPIGFTEYQNYLYLTDLSLNVYLFDNSGVFLQKLGSSFAPIAFANEYLIRLNLNKIEFEPLPRSPQKKPIPMSLNLKEPIIGLAFSNNVLAVLTRNCLYFYSLNLN